MIIPPDWNRPSNFLALYSQRSIFFSFKNVPYTDADVLEWGRRVETLTGISIADLTPSMLRPAWEARPFGVIQSIARDLSACYLVDRVDGRGDGSQAPVVTSHIHGETWGLWIFDHCPPA